MFRILAALAVLSLAIPAAPPAYAQLGIYHGTCSGSIFNVLPRIVRKETVAAVGPEARVTVQQICRGLQLNDLGNAAGLTRTIANNPTLHAALRRWGWVPDNVVGINVRGNVVDLYVYR